MAEKKDNKRITAIVPAYNEADRIGRVLDVLTTYPSFKEVIVIDDGSIDATEKIVGSYSVRYVKNKTNKGKGYSMDVGVKLAKGDIIFFADADVLGLNHHIIDEITKPVLDGEVEMFIGMRNRKIYYLHYIIVFIPLFGGERALTKTLWQRLPDYYKRYFRAEAGLNFYAKYYGRGFSYKIFKGLSQVIKEKKYGFIEGTKQRWRLNFNVLSAQLKLQFVDIPKSVKNRRIVILYSLQSLLGIALAVLLFMAVYIGPQKFIQQIFAKELKEDPSAPFVHLLLYFAGVSSINIIIIISAFIFTLNLTAFLLNFKKLFLLFKNLPPKLKSGKIPARNISK